MTLLRNNMSTSKAAVDNYIGTSYDIIKAVYDSLADVALVADAIDSGDIQDSLFTPKIERQLGSAIVARAITLTTINFIVGKDNVFVYRNGQRLDLGNDYTEVSTTQLLLTFDPNDADQFVFITNERTTAASEGIWRTLPVTPVYVSDKVFKLTGDYSETLYPSSTSGTRVKLGDATLLYDTVVSATYAASETTVTVFTGGLSASLSTASVSIADVESKAIEASSISYSNLSITNATGTLTELLNKYGLVITLLDSSVNGGATDATPVFKSAITFINSANPFTRKLIVPNGTYNLLGETGDDGLTHGIHVPFTGKGYRHEGYSLLIEFESHEAILQDGVGLDKIIRWSACNSFASGGQLKGNASTTGDGLSLVASDEESTLLGQVGQSYNTFKDFYVEGCKNGRRIRCSKSAGSSAYYNKFKNFRTRFGTLLEVLITNVTATNPATITTNVAHGYSTSDIGYFYGSGVSAIDGLAHTMTVTGSNTLTIPVDGTGWSSGGQVTSGEGGRVFFIDWVSGDYSPCNRNLSDGDVFNEVNTGFDTVVADTNVFTNFSGEGVQYGTSPNNIPTFIKDHSVALSSAFNRYSYGTAESIARNLDVTNQALMFDHVVFDQVASAADNLPNGYPIYMINCGSAATYPFLTQPLKYNASGTLTTQVGAAETLPLNLIGDPINAVIDGINAFYFTQGQYDFEADISAGRYNTTYTAGDLNSITSFAGSSNDYTRLQGRNSSSADSDLALEVRVNGTLNAFITAGGYMALKEGVTAPSAISGVVQLYVDTADGDLKAINGAGSIVTIANFP